MQLPISWEALDARAPRMDAELFCVVQCSAVLQVRMTLVKTLENTSKQH